MKDKESIFTFSDITAYLAATAVAAAVFSFVRGNTTVLSYIITFVIMSAMLFGTIIYEHYNPSDEVKAARAEELRLRTEAEAEAIRKSEAEAKANRQNREAQEIRQKQEEAEALDRAFWASPEGQKVRSAEMLAKIEREKADARLKDAEATARLRLAEQAEALKMAQQVADAEEARKEREFGRLKDL